MAGVELSCGGSLLKNNSLKSSWNKNWFFYAVTPKNLVVTKPVPATESSYSGNCVVVHCDL